MSIIYKCDFCDRRIEDNEDKTRFKLNLDQTLLIYRDICSNCQVLARRITVKDLQELLIKVGKRDK